MQMRLQHKLHRFSDVFWQLSTRIMQKCALWPIGTSASAHQIEAWQNLLGFDWSVGDIITVVDVDVIGEGVVVNVVGI